MDTEPKKPTEKEKAEKAAEMVFEGPYENLILAWKALIASLLDLTKFEFAKEDILNCLEDTLISFYVDLLLKNTEKADVKDRYDSFIKKCTERCRAIFVKEDA